VSIQKWEDIMRKFGLALGLVFVVISLTQADDPVPTKAEKALDDLPSKFNDVQTSTNKVTEATKTLADAKTSQAAVIKDKSSTTADKDTAKKAVEDAQKALDQAKADLKTAQTAVTTTLSDAKLKNLVVVGWGIPGAGYYIKVSPEAKVTPLVTGQKDQAVQVQAYLNTKNQVVQVLWMPHGTATFFLQGMAATRVKSVTAIPVKEDGSLDSPVDALAKGYFKETEMKQTGQVDTDWQYGSWWIVTTDPVGAKPTNPGTTSPGTQPGIIKDPNK